MEKTRVIHESGSTGAIYGFAVVGALVYYLQHATSFTMGVIGVFKALFWPGVMMYRVLELMQM